MVVTPFRIGKHLDKLCHIPMVKIHFYKQFKFYSNPPIEEPSNDQRALYRAGRRCFREHAIHKSRYFTLTRTSS